MKDKTNIAAKVFNDLLDTIADKQNNPNNQCTISNVKLFCKAWREELEFEMRIAEKKKKK